jgi:FKBP-type peptidyl-prolyl cis-trans isomerase FkpA
MSWDPRLGPPTLPPGRSVEARESGLEIVDIRSGDGRSVVPGAQVGVRFNGWLADGTFVETSGSSLDGGGVGLARAVVDLNDPNVLPGWREGLVGMKIGGVRRLIIPSDLAHGPKGRAPRIPPYSTLIYDIELIAIDSSGT